MARTTGDWGIETLAIAAVAPLARSRPAADGDDHELVAAVRAGDDRAFEVLYARYHRRIVSYVLGMVRDHGRAEDVTQEVFLSALRRMRETDRPITFKPWLYEIAKNACIDQFRRSRRAEEVSFDAGDGLGAQDHGRLVARGSTPDVAVEHKQQLDDLCGAFGGLSATHHEVLVLRELEGLSYREIGDRLGMTRPAVESTLFRARRRLSEEYDDLVTGRSCERVAALVLPAAAGSIGLRDRGRLGKHLSRCPSCRRAAHRAGVDTRTLVQRPVLSRLAGLLPLPAFLRRRGGGDDALTSTFSAHQHTVAGWSGTIAQYDPSGVGAWVKAAAAAVTVALAGTGVNVVGQDGALRLPAAPGALELPARTAGDSPAASTAVRRAAPAAPAADPGARRRPASAATGAAPAPQSSAGPTARRAPDRPAARTPQTDPAPGTAPPAETVREVLRSAPSATAPLPAPKVDADAPAAPSAGSVEDAAGRLPLSLSPDRSPVSVPKSVTGAAALPQPAPVVKDAVATVQEATQRVEPVVQQVTKVTGTVGDVLAGR